MDVCEKLGHVTNSFALDKVYLAGYTVSLKYIIESTKQFDKQFDKLQDKLIKVRVMARFSRVENGNFGVFLPINGKLFELGFFFGAGLRIYYTVKNHSVVIELAGGDKSSQKEDIVKSNRLLSDMKEENYAI